MAIKKGEKDSAYGQKSSGKISHPPFIPQQPPRPVLIISPVDIPSFSSSSTDEDKPFMKPITLTPPTPIRPNVPQHEQPKNPSSNSGSNLNQVQEQEVQATISEEDDSKHLPLIFNTIIPQRVPSLIIRGTNTEKDETFLKLLLSSKAQLQVQIDQNREFLNNLQQKFDQFVEKSVIQQFFSKIRSSMKGLEQDIQNLKNRESVSHEELENAIRELYETLTKDDDTAAALSTYRCLACGRPKISVVGLIRDRSVVDALGEPPQATAVNSPVALPKQSMIFGENKVPYFSSNKYGRTTIVSPNPKRKSFTSFEKISKKAN